MVTRLACDIDRASRWLIRALGDRLIGESELRRAYLIGDVALFAHGIRRAIGKAFWK
jgi:hypothetical protein